MCTGELGRGPLPLDPDGAVAAIERALVAIRRSQRRRTLQRRAAGDDAPAVETAMFQVLDALEAASDAGRVMTVTAVADALGVDQPRASRLVAQAIDARLVRRGADPDDGRRSILTLTARGRKVLAAAHRTRRAAVEAALAGWSPEDRDAFARLLRAFVSGWERSAHRQPR
ncbi:MAG TPA: MarR family winged helix-turn-helix transcriptional regulator [Actinomycetes bacterium]|jgi:DNA-binding MarR family transcriptional regulator|nr:MarR family winged helix-turn-helix transcriptional regulator [Actinomycetes bacterium]